MKPYHTLHAKQRIRPSNLRPMLGLVAWCFAAWIARGGWVYNSGANTISDGNWTLKVSAVDGVDGYRIGNGSSTANNAWVAGSGDLDLDSVYADCGITLVEMGKAAFQGNTNITSVRFPSSVQSFASAAFKLCYSLTNAVPFLSDGVTNVSQEAFSTCTNLVAPLRLASPDLKEIGYSAFKNCPKLTEAVISDSVEIIGKEAFNACRAVTNMDIKLANIRQLGQAAFKNCNALTMTSPQTMPLLEDGIFDETFLACLSLAITLDFTGSSITTMGLSAFRSAGVRTIIFPRQSLPIGERVFDSVPNGLALYFPDKAPSSIATNAFRSSSPQLIYGSKKNGRGRLA